MSSRENWFEKIWQKKCLLGRSLERFGSALWELTKFPWLAIFSTELHSDKSKIPSIITDLDTPFFGSKAAEETEKGRLQNLLGDTLNTLVYLPIRLYAIACTTLGTAIHLTGSIFATAFITIPGFVYKKVSTLITEVAEPGCSGLRDTFEIPAIPKFFYNGLKSNLKMLWDNGIKGIVENVFEIIAVTAITIFSLLITLVFLPNLILKNSFGEIFDNNYKWLVTTWKNFAEYQKDNSIVANILSVLLKSTESIFCLTGMAIGIIGLPSFFVDKVVAEKINASYPTYKNLLTLLTSIFSDGLYSKAAQPLLKHLIGEDSLSNIVGLVVFPFYALLLLVSTPITVIAATLANIEKKLLGKPATLSSNFAQILELTRKIHVEMNKSCLSTPMITDMKLHAFLYNAVTFFLVKIPRLFMAILGIPLALVELVATRIANIFKGNKINTQTLPPSKAQDVFDITFSSSTSPIISQLKNMKPLFLHESCEKILLNTTWNNPTNACYSSEDFPLLFFEKKSGIRDSETEMPHNVLDL